MRKKVELNEKEIAKLITALKSGKDADGSFFTEEHMKMSMEDKFVEDFILTGLYFVEKFDIKNVIRFECDFMDRSNRPLRAILEDGSVVPFDFDTYINHTTPRQYAYLSEAQSLIPKGVKPNNICKKIMEKSPEYINIYKKNQL